jgi:hypothetical protein
MTASPANAGRRGARQYAGLGIDNLGRSRGLEPVELPSQDEATLYPNPHDVQQAIYERFVAVTGTMAGSHPGKAHPRLTIRNAKQLANFITVALRNDLPRLNVYDAAVIWEKWRDTVATLRQLIRGVPDEHQALNTQSVLDHRWTDISYCLVDALARPGEVADRYCPWKADFFTQERLYPESV